MTPTTTPRCANRYRLHSVKLGLTPTNIIATGGASQNSHFTQIMSNVFGTVVQAASQPDSASLGAACRALQGWESEKTGEFVPFASVAPELQVRLRVIRPPTSALGIRYGSSHLYSCSKTSTLTFRTMQEHTIVAEPDMEAHKVYTDLLEVYAARENQVVSNN
jgi:xylulokinase